VEGGDYFGMPTIEAARLCDKASSDGILASPTARMTAGQRDGLSFSSVGAMVLKGIPEPVEAFAVGWEPLGVEEVVGGSPLPAGLRSAPPIAYVGRVGERERLRECARQAREGRRQAVFLSGEPGIGKSRLAEELNARARERGAEVLVGRCWEAGGAPAFWPWNTALRPWLERQGGDLVLGRKELAGNDPRDVGIDCEIVPFEYVADQSGNGNSAS
jgi:hypothetical protein